MCIRDRRRNHYSDGISKTLGLVAPGVLTRILYHNLVENYEDCIVVSASFAADPRVTYEYRDVYQLEYDDELPSLGTEVNQEEFSWYGSEIPGVVDSRVNGSECVSVYVKCKSGIMNGDKLATPHGQKGVALVMDDDSMPHVITPSGETIVPDMGVQLHECREPYYARVAVGVTHVREE